MLTKLIAVSLDLMKFLKQITYVSTRFNVCCINAFSMSSVLLHGKTLALAGYGTIGVNLQIRPRDFATQIVITLTSIAQ